MKAEIEVMTIRSGKVALETIPNTLEAMQAIVGGKIETVRLTGNTVLVCNEEGLIRRLPIHFEICGHPIAGDAFICGVDGEDFTDIPNEEGL